MKTVVSAAVMRRSDAAEIAAGTPSLILMRRAGEAVFQSYPWRGRVCILCGVGNNAGDGYVLAACLAQAGIACRLLLLQESFSADGAHYFKECQALNIPWRLCTEHEDFSGDSEIVDCLFGTGFHGNAEGLAADLIERVNASKLPVISVDINSGLCGTSGQGSPFVRSALTVALGAYKYGHFLGNAKDAIGALSCADIGIPILSDPSNCQLFEAADAAAVLGKRTQNSHKGMYGYVGILGGCAEYAGAVKLAGMSCAALRSGCGVATLGVPKTLAPAVSPYLLESTLALLPDSGDGHMRFDAAATDAFLENKRAVAVGMGWGSSKENERILSYILRAYPGRLVIDADGLNTLAALEQSELKNAACRILLTPHCKEFSRISRYSMEQIKADPIGCAQAYAKQTGVCLLLKGACTVVTDGETTYLVNRGCAGMATAGSGDVLSGVLAGLLGYTELSPAAAACGAYIAGRAGELAEEKSNPFSMLASDTTKEIAAAISEIVKISKFRTEP